MGGDTSIFYICTLKMKLFAPIRFLYKLYFGIVFFVVATLMFPFFVVAYNGKHPLKSGLRLKRIWSKLLQILCCVPMKIEGLEHFPNKGGFIVVSNHASYLDIILMFGIVPHNFVFMGKAELLTWPFLSYVFGKTDIPVDRVSRSSAKKSIEMAQKYLSENVSIIIFPEGGMPASSPEMARFKNGAFKLAQECNVPIVPLTFVNNWKLFSDHTDVWRRGQPGVSKVFVHPPVKVSGNFREDLVNLREEVFNIIDSKIQKQ